MNQAINTIIVDDSKISINMLENDLKQSEEINIIATTQSPECARELILKHKPYLLFIDIEMPGKNGLELIKELKEEIDFDMLIVFYSAFQKYLINVLRVSAFDFLQKPYFPEELDEIIKRVIEKRIEDYSEEIFYSAKDKELIAMPTSTGYDIVKKTDIVMFKYNSSARIWQVLNNNNKQYKLKANLKAKEILNLKSTFVQVSQNCIINLDYVSSIENKSMRFILASPFDNIEIIASRTYFSKLKDCLSTL